jgi:hypothetical protein
MMFFPGMSGWGTVQFETFMMVFTGHVFHPGESLGEGPADHHGDDLVFGYFLFGCIPCFDGVSVPENRNRIGDFQHLFELVGDVDTGYALLLELADDSQQVGRFAFIQGGGRLVEDENPSVLA